MLDAAVLFFLKNTILVSVVFWALTAGGNYFVDRYEYKNREDFYECGFKSTSDINFNLNFSFFMSAIFLILYDIELILLIPFLFNYDILSWSSIMNYLLLISTIFFTLIIDVWAETIEWNF